MFCKPNEINIQKWPNIYHVNGHLARKITQADYYRSMDHFNIGINNAWEIEFQGGKKDIWH